MNLDNIPFGQVNLKNQPKVEFTPPSKPAMPIPLHGEKDFVGSAKRFVNIASAIQNCCGDNINWYHNNYIGHRKK